MEKAKMTECPNCGPGTTISKLILGLYCAYTPNYPFKTVKRVIRGNRKGCGQYFKDPRDQQEIPAELETFETTAHSICSCGNPRCQGPWHIFEHRAT